MADEELTPQQKLAISSSFVLNSPPAQTSNVLEGVRAGPRRGGGCSMQACLPASYPSAQASRAGARRSGGT